MGPFSAIGLAASSPILVVLAVHPDLWRSREGRDEIATAVTVAGVLLFAGVVADAVIRIAG